MQKRYEVEHFDGYYIIRLPNTEGAIRMVEVNNYQTTFHYSNDKTFGINPFLPYSDSNLGINQTYEELSIGDLGLISLRISVPISSLKGIQDIIKEEYRELHVHSPISKFTF